MLKRSALWLMMVIGMVMFVVGPVSAQEEPPPPVGEEWCARTQGFWKNHPEEWPVDDNFGYDIGLASFPGATREELIGELNRPVKQDTTVILTKQLIAAKLNVLKASDLGLYMVDGETVNDLIMQADIALAVYKEGGGFDWLEVEAVKDKLDTFNNSEACATIGGGGGDFPPPV